MYLIVLTFTVYFYNFFFLQVYFYNLLIPYFATIINSVFIFFIKSNIHSFKL